MRHIQSVPLFRASRFLDIWCVAAFVVSCLAVVQPGCSAPEARSLRVGMELSYPPFEMTDEQGAPAGISVEIANALGEHLGLEVDIQNIPFDGLIPALKTGKIDAIISSMTATPERAKSIAFSTAYLRTGLCLLLSIDSPIRSLEDLDSPGKKVAVKLGTTGHAFARNHLKHAEVLVLEKEDACVLEVVQGKTDAFIYDQMSTYKNWQRNINSTKPILKPFQEESWAIGVRKGNDALLERIDVFLGEYRAKGGFEQLGERFLKEQKEAFLKLGFPFYF